MPSRQDSLRRMRFDEMLKKKDPEMYERYQKERLDNIKRKKSFKGMSSDRMTKRDIERASQAVQGKKYTEGAMPGNKAAAASMSSDRMTEKDVEAAGKFKKGKMIKKYSYGGAAIKGTKFKGVF